MRNSIISRPTPPSNCKALTRELIFTKTRNDNLIGIKNLNLWGNDLEDLSLLKQMPNLQVISLSVNNIKTLKYFQNCAKLQELYLRKNNIQVLNEIEYLMNLPQLKVLWLCDNPCANAKNYRQVIIKNLPFLTKLDNDIITQTERQKYAGNNQKNLYESHQQIANSKVMPYKGNYQSVKPKNNNYLNDLEQNLSRLRPNQKNLSDPKGEWKQAQSPLKPLNKGKKAMSYEEQKLSEIKPNNKISQPSESVRKQTKNDDQGNEQIRKGYENQRMSRGKNENHPKALVGNVDDMIYGVNRSSIQQQKRNYEFQGQELRQKQGYLMNPQFMKNLLNFNNQSNSYVLQNGYENSSEAQQYSSVKKQPNTSAMKQFQVIEQTETMMSQKGSSPNIIMAVMSLLDDLGTDGLELIKREVERKLVQNRHLQKVSLSSAGKPQKRH